MMEADQNGDGKLDFDEFKAMVANTDIAKQMVRRFLPPLRSFADEFRFASQTLEGTPALLPLALGAYHERC
jgi:hypothetical protein